LGRIRIVTKIYDIISYLIPTYEHIIVPVGDKRKQILSISVVAIVATVLITTFGLQNAEGGAEVFKLI